MIDVKIQFSKRILRHILDVSLYSLILKLRLRLIVRSFLNTVTKLLYEWLKFNTHENAFCVGGPVHNHLNVNMSEDTGVMLTGGGG